MGRLGGVRMKTALILAGHGSHISPATAGLVWQQVDVLRAAGVADEITAAFWKETPSFATVLHTLIAEDITIVPLFTAQGFFTRNVIPSEMGLTGTMTQHNGRTLRYTRTFGEHPYLRQIVRRRVEDMLPEIDAASGDVGVALIGHGTKRNPTSRAATEAQAQMLRDLNIVREVVAVYLDDTPAIPDAYNMLTTPVIIAVPNFLAPGSHTTLDVPGELGLPEGESFAQIQGRQLYYTDPVGMDDALTQVILELAKESGMAFSPAKTGSAWGCFPAAGRDMLLKTVHERGEMRFGELVLTPYEVRSEILGDLILELPGQLRDFMRKSGAFRPLATTTDMPQGWRVPIHTPEMIHAVVETVYPGAVADWAALQKGTFATASLDEVAARQQGMFRALANFDHAAEFVQQVCSGCVRYPTWFDAQTSENDIPCRQACNLWMSSALENEA